MNYNGRNGKNGTISHPTGNTGAVETDLNITRLVYSPGSTANTETEEDESAEDSDYLSDEETDTDGAEKAAFDADGDSEGLGEESGSARYKLPQDLVRHTYAPLEAHFSSVQIPVHAHIIPTSEGKVKTADWYEDGLRDLTAQFPLRLARLRDLYGRVQESRDHRRALEVREEAIRVHFNERNNANNERLGTEISLLQKEWQERRKVCETDLVAVRSELVIRETDLREKATQAWENLWELRRKLAAERDADAKTENEREKVRESERLHADAIIADLEGRQAIEHRNQREIDRAERLCNVMALLAEADVEVRKAAEGVQAARETAAGTQSDAIVNAEAALIAARQAVLLEWEQEAQALRERAESAETELRQWVHQCAEALAEAKRSAAKRQGELDLAASTAEQKRIEAAARAGVPVKDLETLAPRAALFANRPASETGGGGAPEEYLSPHEEAEVNSGKWRGLFDRAFKPGLEAAALFGFGAVFSISLGLLLHLFTGSTLIERPIQLGVMLAIGTSIFFIMGKTVSHVVSLAVETWDKKPGQAGSRAGWVTAFAFLTVSLLIGIEAVIEKHGIVDTFIKSSSAFALGQTNGNGALASGEEFAYWMIALIAAAPFTLYHAFRSWRETSQRVAKARNQADRARDEIAFLSRPETREMLAAHGHALEARQQVAAGCSEARMQVHDAETRLTEAQSAAHPDIDRWAEFAALRDAFVDNHPKMQAEKQNLLRLQTSPEDEPVVKAMRERQRFWEDRISLHQSQLLRDFGEALERGAEGLLNHVVDSAGNALNTVTASLTGGNSSVPFADAVQAIAAEAIDSGRSQQELTAEQQLRECLAQIAEDPQVRYGQERIRSLQARLQRMEENYKKRIVSLKKQRRAIELRPGQYLGPELADAATQIQAAQYLFECEYSKLLRLSELPKFMQFFAQVWQNTARPDFVTNYVEQAARQLSALPPPVFNSPHRGD